MLKKGIIDRFEGEYAVIEINGETKDFSKTMLPNDVQVGDVVLIDGDKISIDKEETKQRKERIKKLLDEVWED